ncbi:YesK family protein [Paenibacillus sp. FSL E2-0178]|uniref:YesK family protein n=1 Tax=Paenibacillus sp. FSL E2-0178 TaxID=2921361 RepID=UPI0031580DAB
MNAIVAGIGVGIFLIILSWVLSRTGRMRSRAVFYPGITGLLGSMILLVLSFTVIGGWEGIGYAFFSVPILLISGLLLLLLVSYRRQT